ncbi:UPF0175 family protein [Archaeoglobus veneficus]|uniref:Uncharacterized protein n=1 Tax=Archaeoglobus veneficus (strain DSM 11195 / SNP6) TaxID=693661 RepID=F2KSK9_ARCVS|nr:UPF0175 family protein [Archaeoglobus veneficus]AEA48079.1 protein of unknown function UPF0175 [Archaeoglobus veneficus SNP6]
MSTEVNYILDAITKLGYKKEDIIRDALTMFLAANKELRERIAIELYKEDKISLGKASEIAGLSYEEMKALLLKNNIPVRRGPESVDELKKKAKLLSTL